MTYFTDLQTKRRSIYALGKDLELSNQELIETIQGAVLNTPTAFNSQTSRVVILLDEESDAFWNEIAYSELEKVTPAEAFEATKERLAGFAQAKGTILFYEDQDVVKGLQEQFPLYAQLAEKYDIPANWKLRAQAPFGQIVAPAGDKDIQTEGRFKVFGDK